MRRILILIVFMETTLIVTGQTKKPEIVTDRPDQTEASVLVPKGGLQAELGTVREKDHSNGTSAINYTYGTALIKYGVNEYFELRIVTEYLGQRLRSSESTPINFSGLSPLALGVKIKLADEKGFWPQAALIGNISIKSGSREFKPNYTAADFRFTFAHTLSKKFSLNYNLGARWNGETPDATFLYTLALTYAITPSFGVFVESYSFLPEENKADHRLDGGFTYKISSVVQLDISGGLGLSKNSPDNFVSTGISFRLFK